MNKDRIPLVVRFFDHYPNYKEKLRDAYEKGASVYSLRRVILIGVLEGMLEAKAKGLTIKNNSINPHLLLQQLRTWDTMQLLQNIVTEPRHPTRTGSIING